MLQASYNVRQLLLASWSNLALLILYDIRNDGTDARDPESNFGLLSRDYTDKPSMTAVRFFLKQSQSYQLLGLVNFTQVNASCPVRLHAAAFQRLSSHKAAAPAPFLHVIWFEKGDFGTQVQVLLPSTSSGGEAISVQVFSMLGVPVVPQDSMVSLQYPANNILYVFSSSLFK